MAAGVLKHCPAARAVVIRKRLCPDPNELAQYVGSALTWKAGRGSIDRLSDLIGLSQEMSLASRRHDRSVTSNLR